MNPLDDYRTVIRLKSLSDLKAYMRHRKLSTAYALAKAADLRTETGRIADGRVRWLTSGKRKTCRLDTALAIADALNVPLEALFEVEQYRVSEYRAA